MRGFAQYICRRRPSRFLHRSGKAAFAILAVISLTLACQRNLDSPGEAGERAKLAEAARPYAIPSAERALPDLERDASLARALEAAFKSNGELEAAYYDWRASLERVPQAGALRDPQIEFGYLFNPANFSSFGGILAGALESVRVMASQELGIRGERKQQMAMALAEAQGAGERFHGLKLALQTRVIGGYAELLLTGDLTGNSSEVLRLLEDSRQIALDHYYSVQMETTADIQKAELEIGRTESELRMLRIAARARAAELNGLLGRAPEAGFGGLQWPTLENPTGGSARLFERAAAGNPELGGLRREIEARGAAQTLAQLQRRPAFMIGGGMDDPLMPVLSLSLSLPINRERIRAGIEEALASRQAAEARLRQAGTDVQARLIVALTRLEDAERILSDVEKVLIPKAEEVLRSQQVQYGSGGGSFIEILDTERTLIELERLCLAARADRLKALAEIDELAGGGVFEFAAEAPASAPTGSQP